MISFPALIFGITVASLLMMLGYHHQLKDRLQLKPRLVSSKNPSPPKHR